MLGLKKESLYVNSVFYTPFPSPSIGKSGIEPELSITTVKPKAILRGGGSI